jgi:hypothetical protein
VPSPAEQTPEDRERIARRIADVWNDDDVEAALACAHPEIELDFRDKVFFPASTSSTWAITASAAGGRRTGSRGSRDLRRLPPALHRPLQRDNRYSRCLVNRKVKVRLPVGTGWRTKYDRL